MYKYMLKNIVFCIDVVVTIHDFTCKGCLFFYIPNNIRKPYVHVIRV